MTAAQQYRRFGASVQADGEKVILQVGKEILAMSPREARSFMFYMARAYTRADVLELASSARKRELASC